MAGSTVCISIAVSIAPDPKLGFTSHIEMNEKTECGRQNRLGGPRSERREGGRVSLFDRLWRFTWRLETPHDLKPLFYVCTPWLWWNLHDLNTKAGGRNARLVKLWENAVKAETW